MAIRPTHLAVTTKVYTDIAESRLATIHLYRRFLRNVPSVIRLYQAEVSLAMGRSKLRQEFERQRYVTSMPVISVLIAKGNMEFQETVNFWKQKAQLMKYFSQEEFPERYVRKNFVDKFLEVCIFFSTVTKTARLNSLLTNRLL
ncbi:NADH-ubiquinone oxidoreductase 14.8 kd subunit [Myxozyma melibiosi]|uniref:NADH-ubiquinone oxidoreductase 14.8 kd subunit n=1 Tax=Myxozyma melibiosi TaxID=54550 RepID=A0ABR1F5Y0_9ASCO